MNKKRLIFTSLISIILVSILMIGSTYSIFTSSDIDENLNSYTTGNLQVTIEEGNDVSLTNNTPISLGYEGRLTPYRIVVKNTGNVPYMFNVILADTTAGDTIDYKYLMTKVGKLESKSLNDCSETSVTINGTNYTGKILKEGIIIPPKKGTVEKVVNIDIRVWISDTVQSTEIGKSFYGKLLIDGQAVYDYNEDIDYSVLEYHSFYNVLNENAVMDNTSSEFVSSSTGVDFSNISSDTNGKGLYIRAGTENDAFPILYYRGAVTNNNMIFADTCWKIVRTTETGGLKLIYNGLPQEIYSNLDLIEQSEYANLSNDASYPYTFDTATSQWTSTNKTNSATGTISFNVSTPGTYVLSYSVSSEKNYDKAYFYKDDVELGVYSGTTSGTISLGELTSSNTIMVKYTKDGSDSSGSDSVTFSIGKPIGDPIMACNNTGKSSQIGTKAFNSNYNSLAYVGYMYSNPYTYSTKSMSSITDTYYYGNDVTYSDGTYTLTNTITNNSWSSIYNGGLNNNHYTCFSTGTTCSSVYYIYYTDSSVAYYITLSNGKKVEDALIEMLGADDENTANYNTTSSTIKGNNTTEGTLDYWYYTNIEQKGYNDYLEDTVWCNDRTIYQKNGWNPNGGSTTSYLYFGSYGRASATYRPSLTCDRTIDSFTVSETNGNGNLDYPVGLLTADEIMLAGGSSSGNNSYYLYTGQGYWSGAPYYFRYYYAIGFVVGSGGHLHDYDVNYSRGVRPAVSLAPGFTIIDGNGDAANPYIVG